MKGSISLKGIGVDGRIELAHILSKRELRMRMTFIRLGRGFDDEL
jgi:hypothetical protein